MIDGQLLIGLGLGGAVGYLARRANALTSSGAWAATGVGGLIFGLGGVRWAALLLAFFISSSALSSVFKARKSPLDEKFAKGSHRDWGQVLANGGLGAILVVLQATVSEGTWPWIAYAGAMAAVNADTWATELGVLSPTLPRRITNGEVVERGTSGGITPVGTLASLAGAGLIGVLTIAFPGTGLPRVTLGVIALAGLLGSLFDSLLGATVQGIYFCPLCEKETERHPLHTCGTATVHVRGWRWLNNDLVNLAASILGAATSVLLRALAG
jgi:uncharacterized protein (TIGR00297 family)